jgi:ADP-ribosyl-[dinitrogen reductase] hydrolase
MLDRPFPHGVAPSPQNIRAGILAYAAGDALGVPWEGKAPDEVHWDELEELPARGDWPRGATSDDTDQMLLVARYLAETKGQVDERQFLTRLAKALPRMRGVGPSTNAAVQRFIETGETWATEGSSIGAAMRAPPFGWALPIIAAEQRRDLTIRMSRTTHGAPAAIISACVVAAMAAWAIEQHPIDAVIAAGLREAADLAERYASQPATVEPLWQAAAGEWRSHEAGTPLDAIYTVASTIHVLRTATGLESATKNAVALGGDTDTTAAIVGGILGCQKEDVEAEISWLSGVALPRAATIEAAAAGLWELRRTVYGRLRDTTAVRNQSSTGPSTGPSTSSST